MKSQGNESLDYTSCGCVEGRAGARDGVKHSSCLLFFELLEPFRALVVVLVDKLGKLGVSMLHYAPSVCLVAALRLHVDQEEGRILMVHA
jgi:hypothetical protein